MSNQHSSGSGKDSGNTQSQGLSVNSSTFVSRREARANNATGALPSPGGTGRNHHITGSPEFEALLDSLHEVFERDRQIASQPDSTRCGICYLYFFISELRYRDEEGFYVCSGCEHTLGKHKLPMLRRQQKQ